MTDGFDFYVERDRIRVRFVSRKALGRLPSGHSVGGDYGDGLIRLPRWEGRGAQRTILMHELGHHLCSRDELHASRGKSLVAGTTEEDVCDLLTWLPLILTDKRNDDLRAFLGLEAIE